MFSWILFCWLSAAVYLNPRVLALAIGQENIVAKLAVLCFCALLDLFWFYAVYHLMFIIFAFRRSAKICDSEKDMSVLSAVPACAGVMAHADMPPVALLYTTYNDFQEEAVLTCIKQNYANFHTFILDDSTQALYKETIDAFALRYNGQVSVIRRKGRQGYKAGNINHALRQIKEYKYFSISDADSHLPANYIRGLLPYFKNPQVAFVQARQEINPRQQSAFARHLGYQIKMHCDIYMKAKNKYGYVMFYGHGALLRADVYHEAGGFPEITTEDLAYSMKIREKGYVGIYAEDVVCYEDYPPTYQQYRRRDEKWIRGTTECLFKFYPSFLKSKNITWMEKLDVLAAAVLLLLPFPFFVLLTLIGVVLPFYFYYFRFQGPMFRMPVEYSNSLLNLAVKTTSNLFWKWDFFLLLVISVVSPVIPAVIDMFKGWESEKKDKIDFIIMHTFMVYGMHIVSSLNFLAYLASRTATFAVTGQRGEEELFVKGSSFLEKIKKFPHVINKPIANQKETVFIEGIFACLFLFICLFTRNIWFLTFSAGLCVSILLFKFGFENKLLKSLVIIPLGIILMIMILILRTLQ